MGSRQFGASVRKARAILSTRDYDAARKQLKQALKEPGWLRQEERIEALDLPFEVIHAGTDAALFAELESAYQRQAPVLLWIYARKPRGVGQVSGMFLVGYGLFRFIAEYFREPDAFLGLLALNMSMGQWLCVPMVLAGLVLWWRGRPAAAAG